MKKILVSFLFILAYCSGFASHIVGADFYYRFVGFISATGVYRYEVTLKLYRSTTGSQLQASYPMVVWRNSIAAPTTFTRYPGTGTCWTLDTVSNRTKIIAPTCITTGVSIQEGIYKMTTSGNPSYLDLPNDSLDYFIGWGQNARVGTILNIRNPTSTGLSCYARIPKNKVYQNSSPIYLNSPVSFFCQNRTSYFNQNAFDPDGDSLSFSLVQPYNTQNAGNQTCPNPFNAPTPPNYINTVNPLPNPNGYSFPNDPLGTASTCTINSVTGEVTVIPSAIGVYIIAVVVKEWRKVNGTYVFLCETRRDIQIQTGVCSSTNQAPAFTAVIPIKNADTSANQVVTAGDTICFNIKFKDPNSGDTLFSSYTGPIFDASGGIPTPYATLTQDTAKDSIISSFCWFTECPHARAGSPYIFTYNVKDNKCNSNQKTFTILVNPKAVLAPPNLRCVDILNNDSIKLTFAKPSYLKDYDKYYIYRRTGVSGSCVLIDSISDSTVLNYIDDNVTNALTVSYGYTLRTRSTCSVYGPGCDTVNSIIVTGGKLSDHCTGLTWSRHRQNSFPLYKVYRTINNVKTLVDTTRNPNYIRCDCNTAGKFSVEVDDSLVSCTSHSNITASFSNIDTTAPKPVVITRATVNSNSQIQVDFPKSDSADADMYIIYRSSTAGGFTPYDSFYVVTAQTTYNYIDNSPINSGPYYYRIQVKDSCGNRSSISAAHSPVDLTGTNGNATSSLNWVKKYVGYSFTKQVLQKRSASTAWADYKTINTTDTFYNDTNVIACSVYYYRLLTKSSVDTTIISYSDSVMVQPFDTIRPTTPNVRYISVTGAGTVSLVFDTSASTDTKTYLIYGAINGGSFALIDSVISPTARPIVYNWTGLNPQTNTYRMYVVARDSCGNNLSGASVAHTHVQLSGTNGNMKNSLSWTNYLGRVPSTYQVQRYEVGSAFGWATIKTLNYPDTSFIDSVNIKGCYTYAYRIVSSFLGFSYTSLSDTIALSPFDLVAPGPPVIRYASVVSNTSNKLVVTKSDSLDVNRYEIFFKSATSIWRSAGIVYYPVGNPFVYIHNGVSTLDSNYTYYVKAIDSCGNNISTATSQHTTIQLRSSAGAMRNFLWWTKYEGWTPLNYNVQRLIGGTWTLVKTLTSNDTSWSDTTNLKCNQTNSYRIFANNSINDTSFSDTTQVTPYDTIRPAAPFLRSVSKLNNTDVQIVFNKVADLDVNRYQIWFATNNGGFGLLTTINYPTINPVSITHTGLNTRINNYRYYIVALDSCSNNVSLPSIVHKTINLQSLAGAMTNHLYWNHYEGWSAVSGYHVLRLIGTNWTLVKTLTGADTTWADTANLKCNQPNSYRVYAFNSLNDSSYSDTTTVTPYDTIRPAAPFLRSISKTSNSEIEIKFNTVADQDVNRYQIWYATNNGGFGLLTTISYPLTNPVSYKHTGLNNLINNYRYYVIAIDSCSNNVSLPSIVHKTINLQSMAGAMTNHLYWNKYEGWTTVDAYHILRLIGTNWTLVKTLTGADTSWADTASMKCNQPNSYRIYAFNSLSDSSYSDTTTVTPYDTIRPVAPFLRSVSVLNNTDVEIKFNIVDDQDVNRYQIWYATNNGSFGLLTTINYPSTNLVSYTQTGLNTLSNNYRYYIVAIDSCSNNVSLPSIVHKTINLQSAAGAMTNHLYWNKYEGWTTVSAYHILRLIGPTWTLVKTLTGADTTWADTASMKCNQPNSYRIYAYNSLSDSSYSDTTVVTPYDTIRPAAPFLRSVSVLNNTDVEIKFNIVADQDVNRYQIWYATNNGSFGLLTTINYPSTNLVSFTQTGLNTLSNNYRYYIVAIDSCSDNVSLPSIVHKTINLQSISGAMTNHLYWNKYEGWTNVDAYHVLRLIGSNWTLVKTLTGADTSWADTASMKCNQPNSYRVYAFNSLSDSSYSDTTTVTPYDTIRPVAPFLRSVSKLNNTDIQIIFNTVADQDVNRYQIWYATNNGGFGLLTTINYPATNPVSITHTGLNTLTNNYRYYVVAIDSCSNNVSLPSIVHNTINLQSIAGAMTNHLYWNKYEGWSTVNAYHILRLIGPTWTLVKTLTGADTSWADTATLKCNQPNSYRIYAFNSLNDSSYSDTTTVTPYDTIHPVAPLLRSVSVRNNTSVDITFNKVADQDVNRYQIWYATNNGSFSLVATIFYPPTDPFVYTHTGLNTLSNNYRYYVLAIDSCSDNISQSSIVHTDIQLSSTAGNLTSQLSWTKYKGFAVGEYRVLRLIGGVWTSIKSLTALDSTFNDTTNIGCNYTYAYKVQAINTTFEDTSYSDTTMVTPFDTIKPDQPIIKAVTVASNTSVTITWQVSNPDVNKFRIYRRNSLGVYILIDSVYYTNTYTDFTALPHTQIEYYSIQAVDSCAQNSSILSVPHRTILLSLAYQKCPKGVILNWNNYQTWASGISAYEIYRSDSINAETMVYSVSGSTLTYTDTFVSYSRTYHYRIKAIQLAGTEVSWSDSSSIITPLGSGPYIDYVTVLSTDTLTGEIKIQWNALRYNPFALRSILYYSPTGLPGSYSVLLNNIPLNVNTFTHTNLNTKTQSHYYYMVSVDSCNKLTDSMSLHRSINFILIGGQLINVMHWSAYIGWTPKYYILERASWYVPTFADLDTIAATDTAYMDFPAPCNVDLYYRIKAVSYDGFVSQSDTAITVAIDTLPPDQPRVKNATLIANGINRLDYVTADSTDVYGYALYRRQNNGNWFNIKFTQFAVPTVPYTLYDSTANTLLDYNQYVLITLDSCLNATASDTFNVMQLRGNPDERKNKLYWHPFKGYPIDTYQVQKWDGISWTNFRQVINDTNCLDSPLICNSTHYYRIWAKENNGNRVTISDSIQLIPFDSIHPQPVIMDYATILNNTQIGLQWRLTDVDAKDYIIQRKINSGQYITIDTLFNYPTAYTDLVPTTLQDTFNYRIVAYDTCSENHSDTTIFHTAIQLKGIAENQQATLFWNPYIGFGNIRKYYIQKNVAGIWLNADSVNGNITTYTDVNLPCAQIQRYRILANDTNNIYFTLSDTLNLIPFDTIRPQIPLLRSVSKLNNTDVRITINKVPDGDVNRYQIWYATNNGSFSLLTTIFYPATNPFTFTHTGLNTLSNNYRYYVLAYDSCNNNVSPASVIHNTINLQSIAGAMTNFLYWNKYEGWSSVNGYHILRQSGTTWNLVKTLTGTDTSWADIDTLKCNQPNSYKIYAFNNLGDSSYSDTTMVAPYDTIHPSIPFLRSVSKVSNTSISITFNKVADQDVNRYQIWYATNNGSFSLATTIYYPATNPFTYTQTGLNTLTNNYRYYVVAIDSCSDNVSQISTIHKTINLQSIGGAMTNFLYWNKYEGWSSVSGYHILRQSGTSWNLVKTLIGADTSWADIDSLKCNQPNSYRIYAFNNLNDTSYSDTTMVTPYDTIHPAIPFLRSVSKVSNTSVSITFNKVADQDVNRYQIWFATNNGSFGLATTIYYPATNPFTYTQTGLNTLTNNYRYYVVAIDSCSDNVSQISTIHNTINLQSIGGAMTNFLNWNKYEGWASVSGYHILRLSGTNWNLVKTLTGADTSWADIDSLKCNQPNSYRIYAFNNLNDSSYSDTTLVTPYDTIHPAIPFLRSVSKVSNSDVAITFNQVADQDVNRYQIWYATNNGSFGLATTIYYPATNPFTYTQTGLNTLTNNYRYYVVAIDSCSDNVSQISTIHNTINLQSIGGAMTNFLYWNKYEGWSSVSGYHILRQSGTNWNLVKTLTGADTSWADVDSLKCNQPNSYRIYAFNNLNDSSYSDTIMVTPYDTIRPVAPLIRYVSVTSPTSIEIEFDSVMDQDVNRYRIYESVNGASYNLVGTVSAYSPNPLRYDRLGIDPVNNHYYYYVVAMDSCSDNVSLSGSVHGEVELQGSAGNMSSLLKWHPYFGFANKVYNVQRLNAGVWTNIASIVNNDTNYIDASNISCNVNYYYRIQTVDQSANAFVSYSDTIQITPFDTVKPIAPLLKYVTVNASNAVKVKWDLSVSGDVKFYEIHRIEPGGADFLVGTAVYTDTLIDNVVTAQLNSYCYYVIAIDSCNPLNRSPQSNILCTIDMQVIITPGCVPLANIKWTKCKAFDELPVPNYEVWRTVNGGAWSQIKTLPASDTAFVDSAVFLNNTYCYVIRAFNASLTYATLSDSECVSPWIFPLQVAPVLDVATVTASGITNGKVVLRWKIIPVSDTLTRGYRVYHSSTGIAGSFILIGDVPNRNATTFTHNNANTYTSDNYYFIVAYDKCNYNGDSSIVHRAVNLSIANGNLSETLTWSKYLGYAVKEYEVLKSYNGVSYFLLAKTDSLTLNYNDTQVSCGNYYWYRIKAIEDGGDNEIAFSDIDSVLAYDIIPPVPIVIKQATVSAISDVVGEITITYNSNLERNRKGYKIYRSVDGAAYSLIVSNTITSTGLHTFNDIGLNTLGSIYSYYITVIDSCGNESVASDIHTPVNVTAIAYNSSNTVSWNTYDGFTNWHYVIERYTSTNPVWVAVGGGIFTKNITSWNDSNIICDVMYYYRIKTYDDDDATVISNSDTSGCLGFESYPPNVPVFLRATVNVSSKTNGQIQLDWIHSTSSDATYYLIYRRVNSTGAWSLLTQTGYVNTYNDINLNTIDNVYEYRIECIDNCRNISASTPLHATINLSTVAGNNRVFLSWTNYLGFNVDQYEIYADGALRTSVVGTQLNYTDSMLSCDTAVIYQIKAIELNGNTQVSYSDTSKCTPYDIIPPAPIYVIAASVEQPENLVKLKWAQMPEFDAEHYNIYRKIGGGGWLRIYSGKSPYETTYTDKGVNAGDTNVFYKISGTDNCYNTGAYGNDAKTILLRGSSDRLVHKLWWSKYDVWNAGVLSYDIIRAEDNGLPYILATLTANDTSYTDIDFSTNVRNYCYYIQAHENAGSYDAISNSNIVCLAQHPVYWIPNSFSPGASPNLNDEFKPYGLYFEKYEEIIYNRWGEIMFKSTPQQPSWDGTFNGKPVPTDTYVYSISITGYDKKVYVEKGTVIILR